MFVLRRVQARELRWARARELCPDGRYVRSRIGTGVASDVDAEAVSGRTRPGASVADQRLYYSVLLVQVELPEFYIC